MSNVAEQETLKKALKGGEFLIKETSVEDIFIPEEFSEEQQMMAKATDDFVDMEITPIAQKIDKMTDPELMPSLLDKAGELGLLGIGVPEDLGGLGMSFNTTMLIADVVGSAGSFSTAYGAHTGIGTLPILYYGNEEQKKKYIPKLASGEWKASYCLTEPDAGSDANSGKTKAVLSEDGKTYAITGQKMWITNAGFADVMIVFARIEDDKNLSAFIVESGFGGITMNEEEQKLGIKGSSTRQVFFNDTVVPVENMLSERGNGFKIAVNILNIGRIKLGAGVLNGCRSVIRHSVRYSNERKQFNTPISSFGAVKYKLAEMTARNYATESLCYAAGNNVDERIEYLENSGMDTANAKLKGVEEFAIECAIAKVHGSETLDYVVDEGVQVYGGMGFSEDAPMSRAYRDARIARIYEGTNEINRMLLVGMILKRAMKGDLDILPHAMTVGKELLKMPAPANIDRTQPFAAEKELIARMKKAVLMVAGKAAQTFGPKLNDEQILLMAVADMIIEVYAAEASIVRAEKLVRNHGESVDGVKAKLATLYLQLAVNKLEEKGREAISCFAKGDEMRVLLMGLKRFTKHEPINQRDLRHEIADMMIEKNDYAYKLWS
ncbi:acyl-CoA dehydrogenase [Bernardetia litoralis DSM 6794]|uniref:Acyl-CoA dehydrogenase n=1 Tax=Bernardetia litoralis (strain ATCC 23117 / DSM 6794 / NBRC 15988 / NCIMB 1366 / Fx l1 / Sio-4) TaxID=880071 RepID=I4AM07_BERLS|nr:acyl-CoA dehydrogenase family protein [Bernardetia litoralis]AFM04992.1 acyl-CoA dehydrogenase [Bernardetia litoralis DSM 6794]